MVEALGLRACVARKDFKVLLGVLARKDFKVSLGVLARKDFREPPAGPGLRVNQEPQEASATPDRLA